MFFFKDKTFETDQTAVTTSFQVGKSEANNRSDFSSCDFTQKKGVALQGGLREQMQ